MSWVFFRVFFFLGIFFAFPFLYKGASKGFRLGKLLPPASLAPSVAFNPEAIEPLRQPYAYLARGCQAYVFVSEDQKYVLKLFRRQASREKEQKILAACELAYKEAKEETALLGVHFFSGEDLPSVLLYGPLGRVYLLPLDTAVFALQKKAEPLSPEQMDLLKGVVKRREAKGIVNRDQEPLRNWGLVEGKVIEIDFGSYEKQGET